MCAVWNYNNGLDKAISSKVFSGLISHHTEITIAIGAKLRIGSSFKIHDGAKISVRKGAVCKLGNNVSVNSNNMIGCHEYVEIDNDVQLSSNVQIYDHDHDFRTEGGIKTGKYKACPVKIGNNVWIGANTVILRGIRIGDNCVIGTGCVVKGILPAEAVFVQRRVNEIR